MSYEVVHGWPILPEGHALGQAVGVGVDSRGRVFVFHRAGRQWSDPFPTDCIAAPTVVVFDGASGDQLAQWGGGLFVMPHGLTVDHDDNVWTTDVGLHTVLKLTGTGKPLLTVGTRGVSGNDETHFALPTDVAVLPDGSFYVSDGYGNARVARFDASGRFVADFGARGAGPGQLDLPHGIAIDADGRVYVADRGNARIQIFDAGGRFLAEWKSEALGRPYGVAIGVDGKAYVVDGGDQPASPPDRSRALRLDRGGAIEATFGRFGRYDGEFDGAHAVAVGADGAVFVVDAFGMRVQKFLATGARRALSSSRSRLMIELRPLTLERHGIRLEPLAIEHHDALAAAAADGELWRLWFTSVPAPGETRSYIADALAGQRDGHMLPWVVRDAATGAIIGTTRYHDVVPRIDRVEIGYTWYAKSWQRTHVNTTCKLLLLEHAFETVGCKVVGLRTDNFNFASQRAIEALGARKDGVIRHHAARRDGTVRDSVLYSILASEWRDVKRHLELRLLRHADERQA